MPASVTLRILADRAAALKDSVFCQARAPYHRRPAWIGAFSPLCAMLRWFGAGPVRFVAGVQVHHDVLRQRPEVVIQVQRQREQRRVVAVHPARKLPSRIP